MDKNTKKGKEMAKVIIILLLLISNVSAQDCFYPAHNFIPGSDEIDDPGTFTAGSTVTDDTISTTPPEVYGVTKTFKLVGTAGQSFFISGVSNYKYVRNNAGYYISIYAKHSNLQWIRFGVTGAGTWACNFDILNGAVGTCTNLTNASITSVGDGWFYLRAYYLGNTSSVSNSFRIRIEGASSSSSGALTLTGGETVFVTSPQAQDDRVPFPEYKKYIPALTGYAAWGVPVTCPSTSRKW